jgi:hypothetical protein
MECRKRLVFKGEKRILGRKPITVHFGRLLA